MPENKHTIQDLQQLQALPLSAKVRMTMRRIRGWIDYYGENGVYVSFSGGKDSTVLLHLVRSEFPDVEAVFVDTGLEYPEIKEFVKTFDNVTIIRPKKNFKEVILEFGYPFISKEISRAVHGANIYLDRLIDKENALTDRQTDRQKISYAHFMADMVGIPRRGEDKESEEWNALYKGAISSEEINQKIKFLTGTYTKKNGEKSSRYDYSRWAWLVDAPFKISHRCCDIMKKSPAHSYGHKTGKHPITAQMASESFIRTTTWMRQGCNAFDAANPVSNPMAFWTEQDVLLYIKQNNLEIASVYGEIVGDGEVEGQEMLPLFDKPSSFLSTTGCARTGCIFCGFGAHLEKDLGRFERLKMTHPKLYEYVMKDVEDGGLGYRKAIDWLNENDPKHKINIKC